MSASCFTYLGAYLVIKDYAPNGPIEKYGCQYHGPKPKSNRFCPDCGTFCSTHDMAKKVFMDLIKGPNKEFDYMLHEFHLDDWKKDRDDRSVTFTVSEDEAYSDDATNTCFIRSEEYKNITRHIQSHVFIQLFQTHFEKLLKHLSKNNIQYEVHFGLLAGVM